MNRDYSQLNKQLIVIDTFDDSTDPDILAGIAIRAEDMSNFLDDVETLAVIKYGGATFEDLANGDQNDDSITASVKQSNKEMFENVVIAAENLLRNADKRKE